MKESRLALYTAALGAFTAGEALAATGNDFSLMMINRGSSADGSGTWNVDGDAFPDFYAWALWSWSTTPADGYGYIVLSDYGNSSPYGVVGSYIGYDYPAYYGAESLPPGDTVDGSDAFVPPPGNNAALHFKNYGMTQNHMPFSTPGGYMGFLFDIPGNSPFYGCAAASVTPDSYGVPRLDITNVVYGDATGEAVTCPQAVEPRPVPVTAASIPLGLGLLALGAAYVRRRQRR